MIKNQFVSLATKNAIIYILLILCSAFALSYLYYKQSANIILESAKDGLKQKSDLIDTRFNSYIQDISQDLLYLSQSNLLQQYIESSHPEDKIKLEQDYFSFLTSKTYYSQIRIIKNDSVGQELVRLIRDKHNIHIAMESELQTKGSYEYFQKAIRLAEGKIYFSEINLNKEYFKISYPLTPTLRAATPIFYKGKVNCVLVFNISLIHLIHELNQLIGQDQSLYLMNANGEFIFHKDTTKWFASELRHEANADSEFNIKLVNEAKTLHEEFFTLQDQFLFIKSIAYPGPNQQILLGIQQSQNQILSLFRSWKLTVGGLAFLVAGLCTLIALFWLRKQSQDLKNMTKSLLEFPQKMQFNHLPIKRNDEIGLLADSIVQVSTELKQNIDKLDKERIKAEKAFKEKEEFLDNMSHEIRNPLQSISAMVSLLDGNSPREDQKPMIENLKFSSDHLQGLVSDILDFSKLREGKIKLKNHPIDLKALITKIVKAQQFEANLKKIELSTTMDVKEQWVILDEIRLHQIMSNLLSNAIKFTPDHGKVSIAIKEKEPPIEAHATRQIEFSVCDTGIGILSENYDKILRRFHQEDRQDILQGESGAGLGLSIVTELLNLYGSELRLESKLNQGSCFSFSLNLKANSTSTVSNYQHAASENRLLIIEDDPQIVHLLETAFQDFKIQSFRDFSSIEGQSFNEKFDFIITDYWIGSIKLNSEIIKRLKTHLKSNGSLILLTGNYKIENEAFSDSLDHILYKPVNLETLKKLLIRPEYSSQLVADFSQLYNDYDDQKELVKSALHILIQEWKAASGNFEKAIFNSNQEELNAVIHKLANSLRRLKLQQLEIKWQGITLTHCTEEEKQILHSETQQDFATQLRYFENEFARL
ncbi:MAG TPA: ATP-binding protein [Saprospiraceae bacterium]|nr:ATP-binding protein [Saprospiraceae bacterium]